MLSHPEPLRTRVRRVILERVLSGELPPGEHINESELAAQLGISRTPLREALLELEQGRLVGSARGYGFYVWPLSAREAVDLYDVVAALEGAALRGAGPPPARTLDRLAAMDDELEAAGPDPRVLLERSERWHETLLSASGNRALARLLELAWNRLHRYVLFGFEYSVAYSTEDRDRIVREHRAVETALRASEVERAAELLERHRRRGTTLLDRWSEEVRQRPTDGPGS